MGRLVTGRSIMRCLDQISDRFLDTFLGTSLVVCLLGTVSFPSLLWGIEPTKEAVIAGGGTHVTKIEASSADAGSGGGYRFQIEKDGVSIPVVVVGGSPYQMGRQLGRLMQADIQKFVPLAVTGFKKELGLNDEQLDGIWASTAAFTDDRFEQELLGMAEGAEISVRLAQHAHCLPLVMPYSCSSIACWGKATADGHYYQTRNLDWSLEAGAHNFPVLVVYLPEQGVPHVLPTFAGVVGANCGMNSAGIVLSEMGDSPEKEMPYNLHAPHFTAWFRTILNDANSLTSTLEIFQRQPATKRYHFVFGDGRQENRGVKIRAHSVEAPSERIKIWKDNDDTDELAPAVLPSVVYQDEGRGAFPILKSEYGKLDGPALVKLACAIPIKGGNVLDVVFDATDLRLWVSYAGGTQEAYQRPFVRLDLRELDGDQDGKADLDEGSRDQDGDGVLDFLDAAGK